MRSATYVARHEAWLKNHFLHVTTNTLILPRHQVPPLHPSLVLRSHWLCLDCKRCEKCAVCTYVCLALTHTCAQSVGQIAQTHKDEAELLVCKACDKAHHIYCLPDPHVQPNSGMYSNRMPVEVRARAHGRWCITGAGALQTNGCVRRAGSAELASCQSRAMVGRMTTNAGPVALHATARCGHILGGLEGSYCRAHLRR